MATKKIETEKKEAGVLVKCLESYLDKKLNRNVYYGEIIEVGEKRADELAEKGLVVKL